MDPFLDIDALDTKHPLYQVKRDNYERACEEYTQGNLILKSLPSKITFQTTDKCNLRCPHCQIPVQNKSVEMSERFLSSLETLLPTLIELHPTNLGEPFIWPYFSKLCRLMEKYGVLLDLTTNGTLMTEERVSWILPIARDIKISFDGATAETFERFRKGAKFSQVCRNVHNLSQVLSTVSVRKPVVALQMTLMVDNVHELPSLIKLASKLGANRVKAYHLFAFYKELEKQSLLMHREKREEYENVILPKACTLAKDLGIDVQLAEPTGGNISDLRKRRCFLPWHETWIDVDGSVFICHSHENIRVGSIQKFSDAWNGSHYQEIRKGLVQDMAKGACNGCGMNFEKEAEHQAVPYDPFAFVGEKESGNIKWSQRMRQFDVHDLRSWSE